MINSIIFDFGGVLGTDADSVFFDVLTRNGTSKAKAIEIWQLHQVRLLSGKEHTDSVWAAVKSCTAANVNRMIDEYSQAISINPEMMDFCKELKAQGFKLGLLSNEAYEWADIKRRKGNLNQIFDLVWFSAEAGLMKPSEKIYVKFLSKLGARPSEAIFIDDRKLNVEAARKLGIKGVLFNNVKQLKCELKKLLPPLFVPTLE